jgi:hypothetical protein
VRGGLVQPLLVLFFNFQEPGNFDVPYCVEVRNKGKTREKKRM